MSASVGLDIENHSDLREYLLAGGHITSGETIRIVNLAGGVSNRTVLVERGSGEAWVLKQALAKLRVKVDWFSDPKRIGREALGLRYLPQLAPQGAITPLVFEDPEHNLLAMRAVPQPHENLKTLWLAGEVRDQHVQQLGRLLGTIHRRSADRASELAPLFDDRTYFRSLRLEPYFLYTANHVPEAGEFLLNLIERTWMRRLTLVHGDFSPKNILVRDDTLVLLDHEVIHWGDPAFDLGFCLAHVLSKAHHLAGHRARFAQAAMVFWHSYREELGDAAWAEDLVAMAVRQTLGCLLARVAGRSPLEYLSADERKSQQRATLELMPDPPKSVKDLTTKFLQRL